MDKFEGKKQPFFCMCVAECHRNEAENKEPRYPANNDRNHMNSQIPGFDGKHSPVEIYKNARGISYKHTGVAQIR